MLSDAVASSCQVASLINQAGTVVVPSSTSLTFAAMELGGNLDARLTAVIADGKSALAWPMAGYVYFVIRKNDHVGDCDRRKAAMQFLYQFYYSTAIRSMSSRLGFSPLPDFIRDIVVQRLVSTARCTNGEYALASFLKTSYQLVVPSDFSPAWMTYLDAFVTINASIAWNITQNRDSAALWDAFSDNPSRYVGALTLFSGRQEKINAYGNPSIFSVSFADVAIVLLYNIPSLTSRSAILRVTPDILAGIFSGSIRYWNHTLIKQANLENQAYLPYAPITVIARTDASDTSSLFIRYLALKSPSFCQRYGITSDFIRGTVNFASAIPSESFIGATANSQVDTAVAYTVNSIGFYLNSYAPTSASA